MQPLKNHSNPVQPKITEDQWETMFRQLINKYKEDRKHKSPVAFYAVGSYHFHGHMVVAGCSDVPLFWGVIILGPLSGESLSDFFLSKVPDFIEILSWGTSYAEPPWIALGILPAAQALDKIKKQQMVKTYHLFANELIAKFGDEFNVADKTK